MSAAPSVGIETRADGVDPFTGDARQIDPSIVPWLARFSPEEAQQSHLDVGFRRRIDSGAEIARRA